MSPASTSDAIEDVLREELATAPAEVMAAYLFGSQARGTARPDSDIDVALLYRKDPPRTLAGLGLDLEGELERRLRRPVQVVVLNRAPVDLVHEVLRDGRVLLDRGRPARLSFEVRLRNEYFDLQPRAARRSPAGTRPVTEPHLVAKKLALLETYLRELRTEARPEQIAIDLRERRFVEHTLQIAIQAALDVASHVVSDERLGEPQTNRELFDLLVRGSWIDAELAGRLRPMVGFRNILVHGYPSVDPSIVRQVVEHHLGDLDAFVAAVRVKLDTSCD